LSNSFSWSPASHFFHCSRSSLLANWCAWEPALDVQHRQSASSNRFIYEQSAPDANRNHLDHTRPFDLVSLCRADLGCFLYFDVSACWRTISWNVCPEANRDGPQHLAVCFWLVLAGAAFVAPYHRTQSECKPCPHYSTWLGNAVWSLLAILACAYISYRHSSLGIGAVFSPCLACSYG